MRKHPQFRNFVILKFSNSRSGYTLIELLAVIAIIGLLIGVLIPSISRSLTKNTLASDVDVMRSKIEETRLLAGSAQTTDTPDNPIDGVKAAGYYGVMIPTSAQISSNQNYNGKPFYAIVRLSSPYTHEEPGYCSPQTMANDALAGSGSCLVERVDLSTGVTFDGATIIENRIIGFIVPTQQLTELYYSPIVPPCTLSNGYCWIENPAGPKFNRTTNGSYFALKYRNKIATVNIEPYTGKLQVTYQ